MSIVTSESRIKRLRSELVTFLIPLVLVGYSIIAIIPILINTDSTPFSIFYRFIYVIISFFLILAGWGQNRKSVFTIGSFAFMIFWAIYTLRLIVDLNILEIALYQNLSPSYFYSYALGGCFAPAYAVILNRHLINYPKLVKYLFSFLIIANLIIIFYKIYEDGFTIEILSKRQRIEGIIEGKENVLGPLGISVNGGLLFILGAFNLVFTNKPQYVSYLVLILGIIGLLLGASRGPFLSAVIILLSIFYFDYRNRHLSHRYLLRVFSFIGIISCIIYFFVYNITYAKIGLVERTVAQLDESNREVRLDIIDIALANIYESPIIGDHFLIFYKGEGGFVHNVFIEVFSATGIVGAFFFYTMFFYCCANLIKNIKYISYVSAILFLFIFTSLFATTSGSLYSDPNFWLMIAVCVSVDKNIFAFNQEIFNQYKKNKS